MRKLIAAAVAASSLVGLSAAQAAVTLYPSMDFSASKTSPFAGDDYIVSTGVVALDAATGVYLDSDNGTADPANTRYYGGTMSYTPNNNNWGGWLVLDFLRQDGGTPVQFGKSGGTDNWKYMFIGWNDTGVAANSALPFVIKISDDVWNLETMSLYFGDKATAAVEGTPDITVGINGLTGTNAISAVRLTFSASGWAGGTSAGSLDGFFSATAWNPVSVPEPASLSLLGLGGLALLARRRNA